MLLDDSAFAGKIRELIVHLEAEDRDQAESYAEDGSRILAQIISIVADRSKPSGSRTPITLGAISDGSAPRDSVRI